MEDMRMDAADWTYVAEGGKHVIFAYQPTVQSSNNNSNNEQWKGRILRLRKQDLCRTANNKTTEVTSSAEDDDNYYYQQSLFYLQYIVRPNLMPYVDIPKLVRLDKTFVQELRRRAIHSGRIPPARRKGWATDMLEHDDTSSAADVSLATQDDNNVILAALHVDYKQPFTSPLRSCGGRSYNNSNTGEPSSTCCINVEIKPKAGYMTTSPLVAPDCRSKFQYTRFQMLQQLHSKRFITKGWCQHQSHFQQSFYNPLDLFANKHHSGTEPLSLQRTQQALQDLFDCPQNNLRVWYNRRSSGINEESEEDSILLDDASTDRQQTINQQVLESMFAGMTTARTDDESCTATPIEENKRSLLSILLQQVIAQILDSEELFFKLLRLQKLDVIDIDGAVLVYQRLVHLCDGSHTEAQRLLDHVNEESYLSCNGCELCSNSLEDEEVKSKPTTVHGCSRILEASPFEAPSSSNGLLSPGLQGLCDELESFSELLLPTKSGTDSCCPPSTVTLPPTTLLDQARDRAMKHVEVLSMDDCRYLLQNFLLSLAMCDVSFFVTLCPARTTHDGRDADETVQNMVRKNATETRRMYSSSTGVEPMGRSYSVQCQTEDSPGLLVWHNDTTTTTTSAAAIKGSTSNAAWFYRIKVVDCDAKPARKLQIRGEAERAMRYFRPE